ncbi:MAG: PQQ-binding-like beta-propeller repeat protein [Candidatus Xenobiia bacterium LiM19]
MGSTVSIWKLKGREEMDVTRINLSGGAQTGGIAPHVTKEKKHAAQGDSFALSGAEAPKTLSKASIAARFQNAASAQGVSLDALSKLFDQKAGPLWSIDFPAVHGSAGGMNLLPDGSLYAVGYKTLARYDTATGKVAWQKDFENEPSASYLTQGKDGTLLVMSSYDTLTGLDPATGKEKWSYDCSKTGLWDPKPEIGPDGSIYTFRKDKLAVLSPQGNEKFKCRVGKYSPSIAGIDSSGQCIVKSGNDVMVLSPKGKELWKAEGRNSVFDPHDRDHVFIPSDKKMEVRDRETGKVLWERTSEDMGINVFNILAAMDGKVLVTDNHNRSTLLCMDSSTGKTVWQSKLPQNVESRYVKVFPDSGLVTVSEGDKFSVIDMEKGTPKWTLDLPAGAKVRGEAASPKGTLFVQMDKTIYGLDAETGKPFSQNEGFENPGDLRIAPDGTTVYTQDYGSLKVTAIDGRGLDGKVEQAMKEIREDDEKGTAETKAEVSVEDEFVLIDGIRLEKGKDRA